MAPTHVALCRSSFGIGASLRWTGKRSIAMTNCIRPHVIKMHVRRNGGKPQDEVVKMATKWLCPDISNGQVRRAWSVYNAMRLGLTIYKDFMTSFNAYFMKQPGLGNPYIDAALRRRFGFQNDRMHEAVLNRILDKRVHLMTKFRERYQPTLFGQQTYDPKGVPGYMKRVVDIESRKIPPEDLPGTIVNGNTQGCDDADGASDPMKVDISDKDTSYQQMALYLWDFWGAENNFSPEQRLEGMVSAGLGYMLPEIVADDPTPFPFAAKTLKDIALRCRESLLDRIPKWDETKDRLQERSSRLLARRDRLRRYMQYGAMNPDNLDKLKAELIHLENTLFELQRKLKSLYRILLPKPKEIKNLLGSAVGNPSGVRHRRIEREKNIMYHRVLLSGERLIDRDGETFSPDHLRLISQVLEHLRNQPPAGAEHVGIEERNRRQALHKDWLDGWDLPMMRVRDLLAKSFYDTRNLRLWSWLVDCTDYFHFVVLGKTAILDALGRRFGRRMRHLLRITPNGEEVEQ
jgi:hypothetical protein